MEYINSPLKSWSEDVTQGARLNYTITWERYMLKHGDYQSDIKGCSRLEMHVLALVTEN